MYALVVDDDAQIALLLQQVLIDEGYQVMVCADGIGARDTLLCFAEPCLVLLDRTLPGIDGETLIANVAREPLLARHHYILISGDYSPLSLEAKRVATQQHIPLLLKPFELSALLKLLDDTHLQARPHDVTQIHAVTHHSE